MKKAIEFLREVIFEMRRVTWPGKKELIAATLVVIILVLVVASYIGFVDFILSRLLGVVL